MFVIPQQAKFRWVYYCRYSYSTQDIIRKVEDIIAEDKRTRGTGLRCDNPTRILIFLSADEGEHGAAKAPLEQALACYFYLGCLLMQRSATVQPYA